MVATDSYEEYPHFFAVRLEQFDGPIDLLLHLVKQNELEITKVSLAEVTAQYLGCLEELRSFDLEVAGEYLVIAATLVSIKSSVLLGAPVEFVEDEEGNMVDPHEELLRKLREAEVYKQRARDLAQCGLLDVDVFAPPGQLHDVPKPPTEYREHDPMLLGQAFRRLLDELGEEDKNTYTVTLESVSIVERMMAVLEILKKSSSAVDFRELIPDRTSRAAIIGTFVALLELCKRQAILVQQDQGSQEIRIALSSLDIAGNALSSEFDTQQVIPAESVNQ